MRTWSLAPHEVAHRDGPLLLVLGSGSDVPANEEWLAPRERRALSTLRFAKRRHDWRLGRWVAKQALLARCSGQEPALPSLEILAGHDGAPSAFVDGVPFDGSLSLSHRAGWGLAAVAGPDLALGCDLELVEPRSDAFVRDYLTPGEQDALARWPEADRPLGANLAWSGKECALKALRVGLRLDSRAVEIDLDLALTADPMFDGWRPLALEAPGLAILAGGWRSEDDLLLSWIVARPLTPSGG